MSEGQRLLERCLLLPTDATARGVFADWIQGEGDDPELAAVVRGETGEEVLCITRNMANRLGRFPDLKFLWGVAFVFVPETARRQSEFDAEMESAANRSGQLVVLPNGAEYVRGPGFLRRLFGRR